MEELSLFWIGLLLATPLISIAHAMALYVVVHRLTSLEYRRYSPWFNSIPVVIIGSVVVFSGQFEIPLTVQWAYIAAILLGVAMYSVDSYLKALVAGKPLHNQTGELIMWLPVVFVPIFEEVIFRAGYVFLEWRFGMGIYLVGSALSFGLHHIGLGTVEALFKFENGLVYGVLFIASGSLVPPLLAHCGYNLAATLVHVDIPWLRGVSTQLRR